MRSTCSGVMMPALLLDPRHSEAERLASLRFICRGDLICRGTNAGPVFISAET